MRRICHAVSAAPIIVLGSLDDMLGLLFRAFIDSLFVVSHLLDIHHCHYHHFIYRCS